jgi:F-type H+-transporting ATPase subunit epsilon
MADKFQLSVLTPSKAVFDGVVDTVEASGQLGDFGVLPGHYAYITSVRPGGLSVGSGPDRKVFVVGHGIAQVSAEKVSIVVSSCEDAADIDVDAARTALAEAEGILADGDPADPACADARVDQEMALGRILAATKVSTH